MVGVRGIFWDWTFPAALEPLEEVFLYLSKGFLCRCRCHVVLLLCQQRLTEKNLKHRIRIVDKKFVKSENSFKSSHKPRKYKGLLMAKKARMTGKRAIPQGK